MNEDEFFAKLADYLEDAMPEMILQDKQLMNKILSIIRHEDPKQNLSMLSLLRAWCRKMEVRARLETDNRLRIGPYSDIRTGIREKCMMLAEKILPFFKMPELLPLACQTCTELLRISHSKATPIIVSTAMSLMYINPMKVSLLELVSMADTEVDELPLLDPIIARCFPDLHQKLIQIAPEENRDEVKEVVSIVEKIERMNNGTEEVDRDLLEFCDIPKIVARVKPSVLAGHPADNVRIGFYKYALEKKVNVMKFLDELVCCGLFDPKVSGMAMELLASQFPALTSGVLNHKQLAHIQCIPIRDDSALFKEMTDAIDAADDFTLVCCWVRYLYHKDEYVRKAAKGILVDVFQFENMLDVTRQPQTDYFAETFLKKLRNPTDIETSAIADSLFEIVTSPEQPEDIKKISASKLAEIVLDPYKDVRKLLPDLYELPFKQFPDLMHAVAIRDGSWKITEVGRIVELVRALDEQNSVHLLPILSRIVFEPLTNVESDGANLLRLPLFVDSRFEVRGSCGFYEPKLYTPTATFPLAPIIEEWTKVPQTKRKPICDGFDIRMFMSLVVSNRRLASDILLQIDEEESAAAKLCSGTNPHMVMYLLLMCVLSSGKSSTAAAKICKQFTPKAVPTGLKLCQALLEAGGDCELPEQIVDYVMDPATRRAALSLMTTYLNFNKPFPELDWEKLAELYREKLSVNMTRQLTALLLVNGMKDEASVLCQQKDVVTKSMAFYCAEPTKETAALALVCASNDYEAICTRAAAIDLLYHYHLTNEPLSENLAALYLGNTGETMLSLMLLKLLTIPKIRGYVTQGANFILPFLKPEGDPLFVHAALNALFFADYGSDVADALTKLLTVEEFTNHVLHVISTTPDQSLKYFASDIIEAICSTFSHCSLNMAMIALNHLLIVGIIFPARCMTDIMHLYESYLDASFSSTALHTVLHQIFQNSHEAKEVAMEEGFPVIALKDLANSRKHPDQFDAIVVTCAQFVYGFPAGQKEIFDQWSIETLLDLFSTEPAIIHFFLCLASRNAEVQTLFATETECGSLIGAILDAFDTARNCDTQLMWLISTILNSDVVRRAVYRKKRIKSFISRLSYAVSKKEWALAESMLRVFVTLTFYADGVDELFNATHVPELLEILSENTEVWEMPLLTIFVRNLKSNNRLWSGLANAVEKKNKILYDQLSRIPSEDQRVF